MRKGKLTPKDMRVLDETPSAREQLERSGAVLKDYSLKHRVVMKWDLNEDSKKDMMFTLEVGENRVILDWEEILRYGRWV